MFMSGAVTGMKIIVVDIKLILKAQIREFLVCIGVAVGTAAPVPAEWLIAVPLALEVVLATLAFALSVVHNRSGLRKLSESGFTEFKIFTG
jgi:hypothetical protein